MYLKINNGISGTPELWLSAESIEKWEFVARQLEKKTALRIRKRTRLGTFDDAGSQLTIGTRAKGDLIFDGKAPHPTLIGGTPRVQAAGMIEFRGGKIFSIDNLSGHFKPNTQSLGISESVINRAFSPNSFSPSFQGYIPFKPLPQSHFYPSLLTPALDTNNYQKR